MNNDLISLMTDPRLIGFTLASLIALVALTTLKAGEHKRHKSNTKTFHLQSYNNEGEPLPGQFKRYTMHNNDEFLDYLHRLDAIGLELIDDFSDESDVITSLEDVIPNKHYQIIATHLLAIKRGVYWTQVEDTVIEDETLLAVKSFLIKKFNSSVETLPRIMYKNKITIMEWDGVLVCNDKTFLLECKHKMTEVHIKKILDRLNQFPEKVRETESPEFMQLLGKQCIGVACGSFFPEELRIKSINEFGLAVVYPSGGRYKVDMPEIF